MPYTIRRLLPLSPPLKKSWNIILYIQEEECDDNFNKKCFIEYKKVANNEKIQFCHTPLICDGEGPGANAINSNELVYSS